VRFVFGSEEDSLYSIDLNVEEKCTGFSFDDETEPWLKGKVQGVSSGYQIIKEMIDEQE